MGKQRWGPNIVGGMGGHREPRTRIVMSVDRAEPAQQLPVSVERVRAKTPRVILEGTLFREHALRENVPDGGGWWISGAGQGRFDLEEPMWTCHLGETAGAGVREGCGRLIG